MRLPDEYQYGNEMADRLGRLIRFDERSRNYPLTATSPRELRLRSFTWRPGRVLDQIGGSCTFYTKGGELLARPSPVAGHLITDQMLLHGYHLAQHRDPWRGCHLGPRCPIQPTSDTYEGSSVLAALKVWGWADGYRWAFDTPTAVHGIGHNGPAMTGSHWWSGMMEPDADGRIRPTGRREGGHETLWFRAELVFVDPAGPRTWANLDLDQSRLWNRQAWGDWGPLHGDAWMTVADFSSVQHDDGEVAFLTGRRSLPRRKAKA